jgi:hypothetical protein
MLIDDRHARLEPADATAISYSLLRHLGFMLDELSAQGLRIWQDKDQSWCWAWVETALHSKRGFWSIGEAIVDAVVTRFPAAFDTQEWKERQAA